PLTSSIFEQLGGVKRVSIAVQNGNSDLSLVLEEEAALANVIGTFGAHQARILSLQKREPSLEDVFVKLTGQRMEEVEHANAPAD
ncbi:MAG TPA: DUF4162 domain-containing protein, partial [Anaerolineaceae bacterium]|nr:DUF4162 domain-containing protein [Anaerolineaceae bacterium]